MRRTKQAAEISRTGFWGRTGAGLLVSFLAILPLTPSAVHAFWGLEPASRASDLYFKSFDGHLDAGGKVIDRNVEVSLALTKITSCAIPETVTVQRRGNYNHEDDTIFDVTSVGKGAFYGCDSLESVTFPDRLTNIGSYAFYGCAELDEIVLPSGLASIGNWAFVGCDDLRKVICLGETPPAIRDVFEDRPVFLFPEDQGVIVFVPNEKAVAAYEAAWRKYLTDNVLIAALEQTK